MIYENWKVIEGVPILKKNKKKLLFCKCLKCNVTEKYVYLNNLLTGTSKQCSSCKGKDYSNRNILLYKSYKGIQYAVWGNIKSKAKTRKLPFNLTMYQIGDLFERQKGICALSGLPIILKKDMNDTKATASLDRIDSSKGYLIRNVQWVHKTINLMKNSLDENIFLKYAELIVTYNKTKK